MPDISNLIKLSEINNKEDYKKIKIKKHLPFTDKKMMIQNILDASKSINDNGITTIDYLLFEVAKSLILVNAYSNLDLSDSPSIAIYDLIYEKGILNYILEKIGVEEINFFDKILSKEIDQIDKIENGISNIIAKALNKLIEKLPDTKEINKIIPKVSKEINNINPNNLKFVTDIIGLNNGIPLKK